MVKWVSENATSIIVSVVGAMAVALVSILARFFVSKAQERRYRVSGWYLTRFDYIRSEGGRVSRHGGDTSKALLHLKQRGRRIRGRIQTPQSVATFSCKGRITDTYQLYGHYEENRRRASYQVFFNIP